MSNTEQIFIEFAFVYCTVVSTNYIGLICVLNLVGGGTACYGRFSTVQPRWARTSICVRIWNFFALRGSPYASDPNRVPEFIFPRVNFLNLQQFIKIPSLKYCEKYDNCLYVSSGSKNFATVPGRSRLPFQSIWSGSGALETSVKVFAANGPYISGYRTSHISSQPGQTIGTVSRVTYRYCITRFFGGVFGFKNNIVRYFLCRRG